jgi:uncharacterized damage-inducible protein DinB
VRRVSEAPADPRVDKPLHADEATTLRAFLDHNRDTLRLKCSGLTQAQLARAHPPTSLTLAGLMKHMALVDYHWLVVIYGGGRLPSPFDEVDFDADPDWEFRTARDDSPETLRALFDRCLAAADQVLDDALARGGLEQPSVAKSRRHPESTFSLRWVLLHLIEEYARHNGHADLIRESIDGRTGD